MHTMGKFLGVATAAASVVLLAGCDEVVNGRSAYSAVEITDMSSASKSALMVPDSLPKGVENREGAEENPEFLLAIVETETVRGETRWLSTYESGVLGGTFRVVQASSPAGASECGDWGPEASFAQTSVGGQKIHVCAPPETIPTQTAREYWEQTNWSGDAATVGWLNP